MSTLLISRLPLITCLCVLVLSFSASAAEFENCDNIIESLKKLDNQRKELYQDGRILNPEKYLELTQETSKIVKSAQNSCKDNIHIVKRLAWEKYKDSSYGEALELTDKLLSKDQNDFESMYLKAQIYLQLNDYGLGIHWLEKTLSLNPAHKMANYEFCHVLAGSGQFNKAVTVCTESLKHVHKENAALVMLYRAYARYKSGDEKLAREELQKAKEMGADPRVVGYGF
jgi:tetratricopeptide (TPR) repeat protein